METNTNTVVETEETLSMTDAAELWKAIRRDLRRIQWRMNAAKDATANLDKSGSLGRDIKSADERLGEILGDILGIVDGFEAEADWQATGGADDAVEEAADVAVV